MKSTSKKRTPNIVNLTVKRRYLTQREIEQLMDCARKYGRYGHRDATMILVAYAGHGGLRPAMAADRTVRGPPARSPRQERDLQRASDPRGRDASASQATPRLPERRPRIRFRTRRANQPHRLPPARPAPRRGRQDAIPDLSPHAAPCLRVQARQRWPR